jgi:hypothetical protein
MARTALAVATLPGEDKKRAQFRVVAEHRVSKAILALRAVCRLNDPKKYIHTSRDFDKIREVLQCEMDEIVHEFSIDKTLPPPKAKAGAQPVFAL